MTPDPYPDLTDPVLLDPLELGDEGADDARAELSEADSRLLDALSQPAPAVVTAVEDQPRTASDDPGARVPSRSPRGPLVPVFQEPTA